MGATSDFRRDIRNVLAYYSSTLEAYNTSAMIHNRSEYDTIKVIKTPAKENNIVHIDVNYYVIKSDHIKTLENNQDKLRLSLIVNLMSILEKYLKNVLRIAFRSAPQLFSNVKSNQTLEFGAVIRFENYSNLTSSFLEREIRKIGEGSLSDTSEYFNKHLDIDLQSLGVRWERIVQISKYRNSIVHADSKIIQGNGEIRTIQIGHWSFIQTIDDLYDLSIYVGKSLKEKILESKSRISRDFSQMTILFCVDTHEFERREEFKGQFRFQVGNSRIMQLSDIGDINIGTLIDKKLILIKGDATAISAYVKFVKSRLSKIRSLEFTYDCVYRESTVDPIFTLNILEDLKIAYSYGLDKDHIIESYRDKRASIIPMLEFTLRVIENLPSEETINQIRDYIEKANYSNWPQSLATELERHFMLPSQVISAAISQIRAERLQNQLRLAHLIPSYL